MSTLRIEAPANFAQHTGGVLLLYDGLETLLEALATDDVTRTWQEIRAYTGGPRSSVVRATFEVIENPAERERLVNITIREKRPKSQTLTTFRRVKTA